jgi:hypothetical protein
MSEHLAKWLLDFKRSVTDERYDQVLYAMAEPSFKVEIKHTNETGFWEWAIKVVGTDFWLDTKDGEREALDLCERMGWKVAE